MERYGALLHAKWKPGKTDDTIIGQWAEDNSEFEITIPFQLRDLLIQLQNVLSERMNQVQEAQRQLDTLRLQNRKVFERNQ
jgi:hypothetical protein